MALPLTWNGGVGTFSLREVACRAGVPAAAPYHHFRDKTALLAAVAEEGFVALRGRLEASLAPVPPSDMRGRFAALSRAYLEFALLALTAPVNTGQDEITNVTDSKGNAWTKLAGESLESPQVWYAVNATLGSDLTISFNVDNGTGISVIAWDITGAATTPFDKFTEATGAQINAGDDITSAPAHV